MLANHSHTERNKVQFWRASDGERLTNITMLGTNWRGTRVTGTEDINGDLNEEVAVMADKRTDGTVAIQLRNFADSSATATIFP